MHKKKQPSNAGLCVYKLRHAEVPMIYLPTRVPSRVLSLYDHVKLLPCTSTQKSLFYNFAIGGHNFCCPESRCFWCRIAKDVLVKVVSHMCKCLPAARTHETYKLCALSRSRHRKSASAEHCIDKQERKHQRQRLNPFLTVCGLVPGIAYSFRLLGIFAHETSQKLLRRIKM